MWPQYTVATTCAVCTAVVLIHAWKTSSVSHTRVHARDIQFKHVLGAIQVLRNAVSYFPEKRYEGVQFNVTSDMFNFQKKVLVNTWMDP